MNKQITSINNYGHVRIVLKPYMEEHHITRNALARAINTRFEVINKWYNGNVEKIDADVLARICYVLGCKPGDILEYTEPTDL
jgi:putative transcriptional regulator